MLLLEVIRETEGHDRKPLFVVLCSDQQMQSVTVLRTANLDVTFVPGVAGFWTVDIT